MESARSATDHHSGPDELLPANSLVSWRGDEPVKLRLEDRGAASEKPISIITAMKETVAKFPSNTALATKKDDAWVTYTYKEYYSNVRQAARAFIKLGLELHRSVGIIGFNSPEWFISNMAAIFAGGLSAGIYTTNSPDACHYIADNAGCNIVVVENDQQLQKFLQVRNRLPHLKAIVQYKGKVKESYPEVYTWDEMMALGTIDMEPTLEDRIKSIAPNICSTLIYTSGTTGDPKGVMLSHDNLIWTAKVVNNFYIGSRDPNEPDVVVSYLPLSHIAAQMCDIYCALVSGGTVYFAQPDALRGSLGATLKDVRPTMFLGVPRVWEKMQEAMTAAGKDNGCLKKLLISWAREIGFTGNMASADGGSRPCCFAVANKLVFQKVRIALGFDRCRLFISGAAPIMRETLEFFLSLNIPIMEIYGMSESSGPQTAGRDMEMRIGTAGKEFDGIKTLLHNPDDDGNGEICMGGRHVFMGYLNNEEKTRETIDDEGWLHSGDIGKKDADGYLRITGRIKELIITAGGENIPPILIEEKVRECLPCISNCMLIGDKRKFLSILLTFKTEVNLETMEPKDTLAPAALEWCRSLGSDARSVSDIVNQKDVAIFKAIQDGINVVNKSATSRAQCIQKWSILPRDFSVPGGELGPTLKLKRPVVAKMYSSTIDAFYSSDKD